MVSLSSFFLAKNTANAVACVSFISWVVIGYLGSLVRPFHYVFQTFKSKPYGAYPYGRVVNLSVIRNRLL